MSIQVLSEELVNLIAAGEVIENPSSVVKELVENSIDAGAKCIKVEIKGGGQQYIKVDDDGCGIAKEDIKEAVKSHATSKIKSFDDLQKVNTLGFRGEALPSIASISNMRILSAQENKSGILICIDAGAITSIETKERSKGTMIEVKNLFYNVPVRKKFQKIDSLCAFEVLNVMHNFAFAYPHISFSYVSQDREIFSLPACYDNDLIKALEIRISDIFGAFFIKEMIKVSLQDGPISIKGFIGLPHHFRKTKSSQYLLLNKRSVRIGFISQAVKDGYATAMNAHGQPIFVLHVDLPASFLDVNVNPQKSFVRIKDIKYVKDMVKKAVAGSLYNGFSFTPTFTHNDEHISKVELNGLHTFDKPSLVQEKLFNIEEEKKNIEIVRCLKECGRYCLLESTHFQEGILAIDLKAAYSRLVFDSLNAIQEDSMQRLAIPVLLDLLPKEMALLEECIEKIKGFEARIVGKTRVAIDGIANFININDVRDIFLLMLVEEKYSEKIQAKTLCKFIYGRKKIFSHEEMEKIVEAIFKQDTNRTDPLGNPIILQLKEKDLEALFQQQGGKIE
jgi:DNA mismatch repair protein MutL